MPDNGSNAAGGYDDPIDEESADLLGRAGFARELALLAVASPYGWSTRIGVYGQWGEGKTSVVRLAKRYLEDEGHLTVDYNPWGCRDVHEMISVLADAVLAVAKKAKLAVPGGAKRLAKRVGGAVGAGTKKAENLQLPAGSLAVNAAARFSPMLERWAQDRTEDIEKALQVIDLNRRLIILVDDVDRLDPKLLPSLLFALHEVFAIRGVTFIVALDPSIVGAALSEYHRGFGDGLAFLEKIIQFPRWLPLVADETLLNVAEADRRLHAPFLSASTLSENIGMLPRNPRELRMLVRGFMPLGRAFARHDPDELDQTLLLVLACFRQRFPLTLQRMLEDDKLLDLCAASTVDKKATAEFNGKVRALAVLAKELESSATGDLVSRFERLVGEFCERSILWNAQHVRYHAHLTDRPHALTWREFRGLIATPPATSKALDAWIARHAALVKAPAAAVAAELFDSAVRTHGKSMDESASAATAEVQAGRVQRVRTATDLISLLWFSSAHSARLRTPQNLREVIWTFRHWSHFDVNTNDREQRKSEAALLEEMVAIVERPTDCLALLKPWDHEDEDRPNAAALTQLVTRTLAERAASTAIHRFGEPAGIKTMFRSRNNAAEYVLTLPEPTWLEPRRQELVGLASTSPIAVAENLRVFVESLVEAQHFGSDARALLADRPLIELWWRLITSVRWQARFFRGLEKLKLKLEADKPLPLPAWWNEDYETVYRRQSESTSQGTIQGAMDGGANEDAPPTTDDDL